MGTRTTRSNTGYSLSARSKISVEETKEIVGEDGKTIIIQKRKTPGRKSLKQKKPSPMAPMAENFQKELKKKMEKEISKAWDWNN